MKNPKIPRIIQLFSYRVLNNIKSQDRKNLNDIRAKHGQSLRTGIGIGIQIQRDVEIMNLS